MTASAKTLRALEKAAMQWRRSWDRGTSARSIGRAEDALLKAGDRHAAALKRKKK